MPTTKRRAGRLTRVEAARRAERVIEVAANMFLERGFDATSMEAVAEVYRYELASQGIDSVVIEPGAST